MAHPFVPKYNFRYYDAGTKTYAFDTQAGVSYSAIFKPSGYVFPDLPEPLQADVFEFSLLVVEQPEAKLPRPDRLIPNTVAAIFYHFFQNRQRVVVYIIETADRRSEARSRKFNQWFLEYSDGNFSQFVSSLGKDKDGQEYFTSIIFHRKNINTGLFVEVFNDLRLTYGKENN